jgi:hypothetical protein
MNTHYFHGSFHPPGTFGKPSSMQGTGKLRSNKIEFLGKSPGHIVCSFAMISLLTRSASSASRSLD